MRSGSLPEMAHTGRGLRLVTEPARHPSAGGQRVLVVDHPVVAHRLSVLRDVETDNATFRTLVGELSAVLAYEALRDLRTAEHRVDTPVAVDVACRRVSEMVLLVPILRAGLGMVPAIQEVLPLTEVAHVGLRRDEETLLPAVYLDKLPQDLSGRRVIICDPMLATGGSLVKVCDLVQRARRHGDPRPVPDRVAARPRQLLRASSGREGRLRRARPRAEFAGLHRPRPR